MSHPLQHNNNDDTADEGPIIMKRRPLRPFELASEDSSTPPTPSQIPAAHLQTQPSTLDGTTTPSRTRSILNLTSSTLLGIYQPTGYATDRDEPSSTPWGTGSQTPGGAESSPHASFDFTATGQNLPDTVLASGPDGLRRRRRSTVTPRHILHRRRRKGFKGYYLPLLSRTAALGAVGVLYGLLISHLHDRQSLTPVRVEGVDGQSWLYLAMWGSVAILLGEALPRVDRLWAPAVDEDVEESEDTRVNRGDWLLVVRSIGAFVGIAFAIRKLPWESTMQLSLTLALANPAIWYLIDRSPAGFVVSAMVALAGTGVLLLVNPALVPSPSPAEVLRGHVARHGNGTGTVKTAGEGALLGVWGNEEVSVATWIASVLFVSSVCFGNIGRRLAPSEVR